MGEILDHHGALVGDPGLHEFIADSGARRRTRNVPPLRNHYEEKAFRQVHGICTAYRYDHPVRAHGAGAVQRRG